MIAGLDSAQPPSAAQVDAARAAGYRFWNGYIATRPGVNLLNVWSQADFDNVKRLGSTPIAFCSGQDDPVALRQLAAAWKVRLCLDVEEAIRPDGPWVQPFLDASGAGLYGNCGLHAGRTAAFHVLAWYLEGDPGATWYDAVCPRPSGPVGWQWTGSHTEFGIDVDSEWLDDWFGGPQMLDPNDPIVQQITGSLSALQNQLLGNLEPPTPAGGGALNDRLIFERQELLPAIQDIQQRLGAIPAGGGLTAAQAQQLAQVAAAVARIEAALKTA